jgi:hypothetical protein
MDAWKKEKLTFAKALSISSASKHVRNRQHRLDLAMCLQAMNYQKAYE